MPCERKHIEAIRAWADGLVAAARKEIGRHPPSDKLAAGALFYWTDGPEQRAAFAAIAALAAADESPWRSMESAPRDGTWILALSLAKDHEVVRWHMEIGAWWNGYNRVYASIWMPLPAAQEVGP